MSGGTCPCNGNTIPHQHSTQPCEWNQWKHLARKTLFQQCKSREMFFSSIMLKICPGVCYVVTSIWPRNTFITGSFNFLEDILWAKDTNSMITTYTLFLLGAPGSLIPSMFSVCVPVVQGFWNAGLVKPFGQWYEKSVCSQCSSNHYKYLPEAILYMVTFCPVTVVCFGCLT